MKAFEVVKVPVQGYCGGVRKAIQTASQLREEYPDKEIVILGNLVHNRHVIEDLKERGIETVEDRRLSREELLDKVDHGLVVFTAHGVSSKVREKAKKKGLETADASCPFVLRTQAKVKEKIRQGYEVLYIGAKGHPEAESVYTDSGHVHLVTGVEDIPTDIKKPIFVTNQTTMSILDIQDIFKQIEEMYPEAEIHDEICSATRLRQEAILKLEGMDGLVVVGDPLSNNTRKLEEIGQKAGIPLTVRVECAEDLDVHMFPDKARIAVTSGASTPPWLTEAVMEKLKQA